MKRSAEQRTRCFLATTFKQDSGEAVARAKGPLSGDRSTTFHVTLSSIEGSLADECCGFNISFFDLVSKIFVGKTFRTEVGDVPFVFHGPTDTIAIVFESIDMRGDEERVSCWWYVPLNEFAATRTIPMRKGCGQQMFLDRCTWPPPTTTAPASLSIDVKLPKLTKTLPALIPLCTCVGEDFADLTNNPLNLFRAVISGIEISDRAVSGATSVLEEEGMWSCLVFAHNTHSQLSPCSEINLSVDSDGNLSSTKEVSMIGLPTHAATNFVCALRFKRSREARFKVVGYSTFDFVNGVPVFRDMDVNVRSQPFLRGPFSCEDPRCLSLEVDAPYEPLPLQLNFHVQLHNTPVPATIIEEVIGPSGVVVSTSTTSPEVKAAAPPKQSPLSPPGVSQPSSSSAQAPTILPPQEQDQRPPGSSTAPPAPQHQIVPVRGAPPGMDIYKMLCDIMAEVKELRQGQRGGYRFDPEENEHLEEVPASKKSERTALKQFPTNVVELSAKRVALPRARAAAILSSSVPLLHPKTGERLEAATPCLAAGLPCTQYCMRLEGVTFGRHSFDMPSRVTIQMSFYSLPRQAIGPLQTICVMPGDAHFGPSYSLSRVGQSGTGVLWTEDQSTLSDFYTSKKATDNVYLHLHDSETGFYLASTILCLGSVCRPPTLLMTSASLQLPLFEDLSWREQTIPDNIPLIATTDIGLLHVTLAAVAAPAPHQPVATRPGGSSTLTVKKLPIDFGGEVSNDQKNTGDIQITQQNHGSQLHQLRVNYVRTLLQDRDMNAAAKITNGGIIPPEHELKLRYVERRRDEVKSTKIADALRVRITTSHDVCAWQFSTQIISSEFTNPYSQSATFFLEVPQTSSSLRLHPDFKPTFVLGPRETLVLRFVVKVGALPSGSTFVSQAIIRTSRHETVRVINMNCMPKPPLVHRRYELLGVPGEEVKRRVHARVFPLADSTIGHSYACSFIVSSSQRVGASSEAIVEPVNATTSAAWEQVRITATMPQERERVYISLFRDRDMTDLWEVWELSLIPAQRFESRSVSFGQTSSIAIPVVCEKAFPSDPTVAATVQRDCVVLRVRPAEPGVSSFQLHTIRRDASEDRVVITIPCTNPQPTFEDNMQFSRVQAASTIFRRLTFTNQESVEKAFCVSTTYNRHVSVEPDRFVLAPGEKKVVQLRFIGLNYLSGESRWPIWIFVNDESDITIESYLLNVSILETIPIS